MNLKIEDIPIQCMICGGLPPIFNELDRDYPDVAFCTLACWEEWRRDGQAIRQTVRFILRREKYAVSKPQPRNPRFKITIPRRPN